MGKKYFSTEVEHLADWYTVGDKSSKQTSQDGAVQISTISRYQIV